MTGIDDLFHRFTALLAVAVLAGTLALWLRQPLIVAFIGVGVLAGPAVLGLVLPGGELDLLARVGVALLLFTVGLKLDLHVIRNFGPVSLATGLGQVVFTSVIGFLLALLLGFPTVPALYVAVALTFSSTIIIVKLLSDKREIDALHGRIAVGMLIVQDLVVLLVMIALTAFGAGEHGGAPSGGVLSLVLRGAAFLGGVALLMRYVLPALLHRLAKAQELLVLFGISWAVVLAALGDLLGFSSEVGAFLAGVSLASTEYREALGTRLVSLRNFLLLFFFVELGARLELAQIGAVVGPATVLSLFVLIGNPIIVMVIMGLMGYRRRTGFLTGLTVAQISEFSLLLGALGLKLGHIDGGVLALITLVGLVTIGLSTYLILYSHRLYERLSGLLAIFERRAPHREESPLDAGGEHPPDVILFGLGRFGHHIGAELRRRGLRVLGVDSDPEAVRSWRRQELPALYGDAEDPELPATLPLAQTPLVVSAIPVLDANLALLHGLRHHGYPGRVVVTAHGVHQAERLRAAGAHHVLLPFLDAAREAAATLIALSADGRPEEKEQETC